MTINSITVIQKNGKSYQVQHDTSGWLVLAIVIVTVLIVALAICSPSTLTYTESTGVWLLAFYAVILTVVIVKSWIYGRKVKIPEWHKG